jgi:hypothetical protein
MMQTLAVFMSDGASFWRQKEACVKILNKRREDEKNCIGYLGYINWLIGKCGAIENF